MGKKSCVKRTTIKKWTQKLKNKNHNEILPYICQIVYYQYIRTNNAGENLEKTEPSYTVSGSLNWCNHDGEQYGGSSKILELTYDPGISFLSIYPGKRCRCAQLCPTLCSLTDCSPPGSPIHGIFQARITAISFSRGDSWSRDRAPISCVSCIARQTIYHWATREGSSPSKWKY